MFKKILSVVWLLFILTGTIYARNSIDQNGTFPQGQQGSQGGPVMGGQGSGQHKTPPLFTINPCQGKSEGTVCEMTTPHGPVSGICAYTSDKKYLFCRRSHRKAHRQGQQQGQGGFGMRWQRQQNQGGQ